MTGRLEGESTDGGATFAGATLGVALLTAALLSAPGAVDAAGRCVLTGVGTCDAPGSCSAGVQIQCPEGDPFWDADDLLQVGTGVNEVYRLRLIAAVDGGTFTLTFDGATTAPGTIADASKRHSMRYPASASATSPFELSGPGRRSTSSTSRSGETCRAPTYPTLRPTLEALRARSRSSSPRGRPAIPARELT